MPPKGIEAKTPRLPRQMVRKGRGVAGYTGKVELYDPVKPEPPIEEETRATARPGKVERKK